MAVHQSMSKTSQSLTASLDYW